MKSLVLHPDCPSGPITRVAAEIAATPRGCRTRFELAGDIAAIIVPNTTESVRRDNLWKTTCLEIFWQPVGDTFYREFNLSPSNQWACYDFDDFRLNSRDAPVEAINITCGHSESRLTLEAEIASDLPLPAKIALNAIVEDDEGRIQFWALAFPTGKAEFHSEVCRALDLEAGA